MQSCWHHYLEFVKVQGLTADDYQYVFMGTLQGA